MVSPQKKIAVLHRYPKDMIKETNSSFPYLLEKGIDVLTFKSFDRLSHWKKHLKSILWIFYAPFLVIGKSYDVIYCDDSYPFYPILVKLASPKSKVVLRIGDFHLMYYFSGITHKLLHWIEKIGWRMADEIIVISEAMADKLREEWFNSKIVLDPVDTYIKLPRKISKPFKKIVMFHGVLTKNKGVDVLIKAAEILSDVNFCIIGEGQELKFLKSISPANVSFMPWVPRDNIYSMLIMCDIGVALRNNNPGNEYVVTSPFLQYGVIGKPCLVTRRKVFGDYEWQFSGVDELVDKIEILLNKPKEGMKLQKFVLKHHSAENIANDIWNILTQA